MKRLLSIALFIMTVIALCTAATIFAIGDIQKNNYLERSKSLNTIMAKMGEHLNISFNREWERAHSLTRRIEGRTFNDVDALTNALGNIYSEIGADFKVIDDKGIAYYHDGTHEYWKDHRSILPDKETFLLSAAQFGGTKENYMKYIVPLKEPIVFEDRAIVYAVLNEPLGSLQQDFDTTSFGEDCLSFVIDENGAFIYENGSNDSMANSYNLISYIEKNVEFQYGETFERFKYNLQNGVDDTALIAYADQNYYMCYVTLSLGNWSAVMLVPEKNFQSDDVSLTQRLLFDISIVFATAALLFILGFLYMWRKTVVKQRLATEAQRRSNEAKTKFFSSMSHDIRTPMNAVVGMTELALRCKEPMPDSVREHLVKIQNSSNHLVTLINDILDISKIEVGRMWLNISEFSIIECINSMVNMICPLARKKNIDLRVHTHNIYREYILGDDLRINQVYINLATNAIKYTPKGGQVDIDITEEPIADDPNALRLKCSVKDNGIGISEEFQKVMYDSFARATDSRLDTVEGSGLGLAICRQIVSMMNGTLDCESTLGEGTTFTAVLTVESPRPDDVFDLPPMKVLVIDSDAPLYADRKRGFEKLGVNATILHDAAELPKLFTQETAYDMAFVELGVPSNRGFDVVRLLQDRFGKQFPIILTDIADMADYSEQIAEAGVRHTMSKPYFIRTVYQAIKSVIGGDAPSSIDQSEERIPSLFGMNILVAEDNDLNWEILVDLLNCYGVAAPRAKNGQECVDILEAAPIGHYAAVLMDVRMPVMDGREATRILRNSQKEWIRKLPIIAMTADAFAEDIKECLEAGMDAHLSKPINLEKLLAVLYGIMNGEKDSAMELPAK